MKKTDQHQIYITRNPYTEDNNSQTEKQAGLNKSRKRRRRRKQMYRFFLVFLLVLSIAAGIGAAKIKLQIDYVLNQADRTSDTDLSDMAMDGIDLFSDKDVINILLIGADKRESWKEQGRSDSTMIATLDIKHKRLKLTSLMRDMYIPIPGKGSNRFNAAYSFGGVSLLYETIASNFGIKMDGYVVVDFKAFKDVINTLGGVHISLTDAEHHWLVTNYKKGSVLDLKPGVNNMNGAQALAYTRIRQDAKGDFGRTERQRAVLLEVFREVKSMPFTKINELAVTVMSNVSTDLSNKEIIGFLKTILMMGTTDIDQMRIPVDNSYGQARIRGMAILLPDYPLNSQIIKDFIFNYNGETSTKEIIANEGGIPPSNEPPQEQQEDSGITETTVQ